MLPAQALDIRPEHTVLEYQTQSLGGQHSLQGAKKTSHIYIYASVKVHVVYAECKGIRQNSWP